MYYEGVVIICGLSNLSDSDLLEVYRRATLLNLEENFLNILEHEINKRGLLDLSEVKA
ncbi:sporulation histidine kinase inhibitor Sda [Mesobacillus harenae]|uniref:sporulation histidine kinase inhibitor Sda n=1 Tax=Mesobacillus harenae TaxID=2213203 RepID=UPI001580A0E4|nr:sporulation histidine kinase inhibitor Sda [Mesobacillus harenae]